MVHNEGKVHVLGPPKVGHHFAVQSGPRLCIAGQCGRLLLDRPIILALAPRKPARMRLAFRCGLDVVDGDAVVAAAGFLGGWSGAASGHHGIVACGRPDSQGV